MLAIIAPLTITTLTGWLFLPGRPAFFPWQAVTFGGYALAFALLIYPMMGISNVMQSLKSRKLRKLTSEIDELVDKIEQLEAPAGRIEVDKLVAHSDKLSTLRKHYRYKLNEYNELAKMQANPIDISIVIKLFSAAGAPLLSLLLKRLLPFFI